MRKGRSLGAFLQLVVVSTQFSSSENNVLESKVITPPFFDSTSEYKLSVALRTQPKFFLTRFRSNFIKATVSPSAPTLRVFIFP
ncbi:hypothetical protein ACHAW6_010203 [Cyclotella cf. meneghiniana]